MVAGTVRNWGAQPAAEELHRKQLSAEGMKPRAGEAEASAALSPGILYLNHRWLQEAEMMSQSMENLLSGRPVPSPPLWTWLFRFPVEEVWVSCAVHAVCCAELGPPDAQRALAGAEAAEQLFLVCLKDPAVRIQMEV